MDHFKYKKGKLYAEDVLVEDIVAEVGTPFYLYSSATLKRHYEVMNKALKLPNKLICFATKANSNISILNLLANQGAGADVVSQGEIYRALTAGVPHDKIVFSGVGKSDDEIAYGLQEEIHQFNAESLEEIREINAIAKATHTVAPLAIRINPNVGAGGNKKISTGKKGDKFGIDIEVAEKAVKLACKSENIDFRGLSVHIGSQILDISAFETAFRRVFEFVIELEGKGAEISTIDLGGGLGVPYDDDTEVDPAEYGKMITKLVKEYKLTKKEFIFEPGRVIAANAGILVGSVIFVKKTKGKDFAILDVAMNDLMRPALYDAKHQIIPLEQQKEQNKKYDFVGPVCETTDVFEKDKKFQELKSNDLIAFRSCGAYGAVMANEYNTRPLIPEVLVEGKKFKIIRRRPSYEEMLYLEFND